MSRRYRQKGWRSETASMLLRRCMRLSETCQYTVTSLVSTRTTPTKHRIIQGVQRTVRYSSAAVGRSRATRQPCSRRGAHCVRSCSSCGTAVRSPWKTRWLRHFATAPFTITISRCISSHLSATQNRTDTDEDPHFHSAFIGFCSWFSQQNTRDHGARAPCRAST